MSELTLSEEEIVRVTGGYKQPAAQLAELHRQGFYRARRGSVTGRVILERDHYQAVCQGAIGLPPASRPRPQLQPV